MKKIYLNPATQMHEVHGVALMQAASNFHITGDIIDGGDAGGDANGGI